MKYPPAAARKQMHPWSICCCWCVTRSKWFVGSGLWPVAKFEQSGPGWMMGWTKWIGCQSFAVSLDLLLNLIISPLSRPAKFHNWGDALACFVSNILCNGSLAMISLPCFFGGKYLLVWVSDVSFHSSVTCTIVPKQSVRGEKDQPAARERGRRDQSFRSK